MTTLRAQRQQDAAADRLPSALDMLLAPGRALVDSMRRPELASVRCPHMRGGRGGNLTLRSCAGRYRAGTSDHLCNCAGCSEGADRLWELAQLTGGEGRPGHDPEAGP